MINIEEFDSNLLKIDIISYKDIDIFYIGYITIKKIGDYENTVYLQCNSFVFDKWQSRWTYRRKKLGVNI